MSFSRHFTIGLVLTVLGCTAGCSSSSSTASLDPAMQHYEAGSLSLAKMEAQRIYERQDGDRWQAAWVIGLCNQRLGRMTAARVDFELAADSPDPTLAAKARAMLGQNLMDSGQPELAAIQFEHAWPNLTGEDRRQCAEHASNAWAAVGRQDQAQRWQALADTPEHSGTTTTAAVTSDTPATHGRFTIQAGAYRDADGAQRARSDLASRASTAGFDAPTIRTRTDRHGTTLYLVQVGNFQSRHAAQSAMRSLRDRNLIVVASP
jgi:hypothetical protein